MYTWYTQIYHVYIYDLAPIFAPHLYIYDLAPTGVHPQFMHSAGP